MIVINFTHPLTIEQQGQIESLAGETIALVRDIPCHLDNERPYAAQIKALVDTAGFSSLQWQTEAILINPPAYAPAAAVLLAELHGRMGHFSTIIRIRPVHNSTPPRYETAEIINLRQLRAESRQNR